jgi:regulator of replication initiation timing
MMDENRPQPYQPSRTKLGQAAGYTGPFEKGEYQEYDSGSHISTEEPTDRDAAQGSLVQMAYRQKVVDGAIRGSDSHPSDPELRRQVQQGLLDREVSGVLLRTKVQSDRAGVNPSHQTKDIKVDAGIIPPPSDPRIDEVNLAIGEIKESGHDRPAWWSGSMFYDAKGEEGKERLENLESLKLLKKEMVAKLSEEIAKVKQTVDLMFDPTNEYMLMEAMRLAREESEVLQRIALGLAAAEFTGVSQDVRWKTSDEKLQSFVKLYNEGRIKIKAKHYGKAADVLKVLMNEVAFNLGNGNDNSRLVSPIAQVARGYIREN